MPPDETHEPKASSFARGFINRRCRRCGRWPDQPYDSEVSRFFAGTSYDLVTRRVEFPRYDLPQLERALDDCFPDWELVAEGGDRDADSGALWTPETVRIEMSPRGWAECPVTWLPVQSADWMLGIKLEAGKPVERIAADQFFERGIKLPHVWQRTLLRFSASAP